MDSYRTKKESGGFQKSYHISTQTGHAQYLGMQIMKRLSLIRRKSGSLPDIHNDAKERERERYMHEQRLLQQRQMMHQGTSRGDSMRMVRPRHPSQQQTNTNIYMHNAQSASAADKGNGLRSVFKGMSIRLPGMHQQEEEEQEKTGVLEEFPQADDFSLPSSLDTRSDIGLARNGDRRGGRRGQESPSGRPADFSVPVKISGTPGSIDSDEGSSICSGAHTADEREFEAQCQVEIERLHSFFVEWFLGAVPKTRREFAQRAAGKFSLGFHVISPRGDLMAYDDLCSGLYDAWGSRRNCGGFDIKTQNCVALWVKGRACLMRYEEWQHNGDEETLRVCTALFRMHSSRNAGVEWVHLHETFVEV